MFACLLFFLSPVIRGIRSFFHEETLESPTGERYKILKSLGSGSYGDVVLARNRRRKVAIKKVHRFKATAEREILTLGCQNKYLVGLKDSFSIQKCTFLVMDFANGGTLMQKLQSSGKLSTSKARMFAAEIAVGLQFLHTNGIIYRDLKPANILLHNGHIQLTDFGISLMAGKMGTAHSTIGTPFYMAPEMILGRSYSISVDWWAYGVVIHEMIIGTKTFRGFTRKEIFRSILKDAIVFPPNLDPVIKGFIQDLLRRNPKARSGWPEVRGHPFMDDVHKKGKRCYVPMRETL